MFVSFRAADPPPLGAGGVLGIVGHSDCGTGLTVCFFFALGGIISPRPLAAFVALLRIFTFPPTRFRPAPPFQVIWQWFS